jgi:2,3,4,5-tetrahydropyridine-2-carboxylate N-succinyltransferase
LLNPFKLKIMFTTTEEFTAFNNSFISAHEMPVAFTIGVPFRDDDGKAIAMRFLSTNGPGENQGFMAVVMEVLGISSFSTVQEIALNRSHWEEMKAYLQPFLDQPGHANIEACRFIPEDGEHIIMVYPSIDYLVKQAPVSSLDVNGRLALISGRHFRPNSINLDGIFPLLPNLYFTTDEALTEDQWQRKWRAGFRPTLLSRDKFPPLWWAIPIPSDVRIADPSRVRFGAHLAQGTTVMHEGFVNFNAGTLGQCMVEGRISAGVVVGADSDLGGGASIAGTLSGGGKEKITIGENCLIGANAGTGISLGPRCTIEAGLYVTPGTKVFVVSKGFSSKSRRIPYLVQARELSGKPDMLFIRNSTNGKVELRFNTKPNKLNEVLHTSNAKK